MYRFVRNPENVRNIHYCFINQLRKLLHITLLQLKYSPMTVFIWSVLQLLKNFFSGDIKIPKNIIIKPN